MFRLDVCSRTEERLLSAACTAQSDCPSELKQRKPAPRLAVQREQKKNFVCKSSASVQLTMPMQRSLKLLPISIGNLQIVWYKFGALTLYPTSQDL